VKATPSCLRPHVDPSTFSSGELKAVREIRARVAGKYSPLNINVTTVEPGNIYNLETLQLVIGGNGHWSNGARTAMLHQQEDAIPDAPPCLTRDLSVLP
jgi:hypothetical protein